MYFIKTEINLIKQSLQFLSNNKDLFILMALNLIFIATIIIMPFALVLEIAKMDPQLSGINPIWVYWSLPAVVYLFVYCSGTFINAALISCIAARMQNQTASITDGLRVAISRLPSILAWGILSAIIGVILRQLSNQVESKNPVMMVVAVISMPLSFLYDVSSYFILPYIVLKDLSLSDAIKEAKKLSLFRSIRVASITWLIAIPGFMIIFAVCYFITKGQLPLDSRSSMVIFTIVVALLIAILQTFGMVLVAILKSAQFIHYVENNTMDSFNNGAFFR
ncbi:MAG: DUF6159 family protein [Gammaproteobacteria bacterium]|nr:DUF6159 family protein [Gammaproteobacteria bacterium]